MAIYHFDASVISRSKGRSATAASAYRTAAKIEDHRTGEVHDYTRKGGVLHTEIIAPDNAPAWVHDRSALWNGVEAIERRKDSQVAREVRVALPSELSTEQNAALVRAFVQEQFVARGMIADVALHAPGREGDQRNHHAHIMLTTRDVGPEGFGAKNCDWNAKPLLLEWRESWAKHVNDTLERCDIHERVDHRTLVAQREEALSLAHDAKERHDEPAHAAHMARAVELDRPALPSMSAGSWSMMRRGLTTPAAERWQEVKQIAAQAREIAAEFKDWAQDWLERTMSGMQERPVAVGPSERFPVAPSPLERLRDAMSNRRETVQEPQTRLEQLRASLERSDTDVSASVEKRLEDAARDLKDADENRERQSERERQQKINERDGPDKGGHER